MNNQARLTADTRYFSEIPRGISERPDVITHRGLSEVTVKTGRVVSNREGLGGEERRIGEIGGERGGRGARRWWWLLL